MGHPSPASADGNSSTSRRNARTAYDHLVVRTAGEPARHLVSCWGEPGARGTPLATINGYEGD